MESRAGTNGSAAKNFWNNGSRLSGSGMDYMYIKMEKERVRVKCAKETCPWLIYVAKNSATLSFEFKTFNDEHTCGRDYGNNLADRVWETDKAFKAARETVLGNEKARYEKLRNYMLELHRSNPGSTTNMEVVPFPHSLSLFERIYICLEAYKTGFKAGCKPLIELDGCFLKGYYGGQLLCAVAQDANNHSFGLVHAMKDVMPNVHHRHCVLHIWKNFRQRFKDKQTEGLVWAFFSHFPKNDRTTNNMCEVWNATIVDAREKPILTRLEEIRCTIIKKMANHKWILSSYTEKLAPAQQKRVDKFIKPGCHKWIAQWSGDNNRVLFEITRGKQKLEMNLQQHTCTCNMWQLSGMLCVYAVAAISKLRVRTAEDFVSPLLTMDAIRTTYNVCVKPVNSEEFWKEASQPKPDPPRITRPAGRSKK
ncbi:uncharacterized protein LOC130980435 [Arachis stenosperma]|uniref:uncharacterized protein LOC130980435 n=1 Tax=Arachis stenosperma TaxID=217475 RepID=UPI0025AC525E|nr:uncharacterized protein LOC130980435 [Arachis stenosperma]